MKKNDLLYVLILLASAIFFFIPNLGKVHLFDWDEINFAESAREMIVTGNYSRVQINFQPFWEKPPLFFWLQVLSMHLFGINEFAARFPNALFGIISLLSIYFIGEKAVDQQFGFIWAISYLGSFLPHLYFKSGIIDPVFNYFIFIGIYFIYREIKDDAPKRSIKNALLAGIFIGLANLTKGPVGLLIFLLSLFSYWAMMRFKRITSFRNILIFSLSFSVISFFWFGIEVIQHGPSLLKEFISYQVSLFLTPVAGHQQPFYYHFLVIFLGCFPISVFALPVLLNRKSDKENEFTSLMRILFWVVMILFSIVSTKIVHYSSLTYFSLSFLASIYIHRLINDKIKIAQYVFWLLIVFGSVFSILLICVPIVAQHKDLLIPWLKDPFAVACLQTPVKWNGYEFLIGLIYFALMITSLIMIQRTRVMKGAITLFYSTAFCMFFYLAAVVPKIEGYSQAPAVNFYKSLAGKDVYVTPIGFKSYAQYFYFRKPALSKYGENEADSLLYANIERPAYFVSKITNEEFFKSHPDCKRIKQEGGFLFYVRMP